MNELVAIVLRGLVPTAIATTLVLLARRRLGEPWRSLATCAALSWGLLAGYVAVEGWPKLALDVEFKDRLAYVALLLPLAALPAPRTRAVLLLRFLACAGFHAYVLHFMWRWHWSAVRGTLTTVELAALLYVSWSALESALASAGGRVVPWSAAALAALGGGALALGGSSTLGLLAGILAVAFGALGLVGGPAGAGRGAAPLLWIQAGLVEGGTFAADLSLLSAVLLLVAPWTWYLLPSGAAPTRRRLVLQIGALLLLALAALGIELARSTEPLSDPR